jgi:hypothetical protein
VELSLPKVINDDLNQIHGIGTAAKESEGTSGSKARSRQITTRTNKRKQQYLMGDENLNQKEQTKAGKFEL